MTRQSLTFKTAKEANKFLKKNGFPLVDKDIEHNPTFRYSGRNVKGDTFNASLCLNAVRECDRGITVWVRKA
jgi:hypothetical protein